jgi:chloramphenicol O-acetyltransferase type B
MLRRGNLRFRRRFKCVMDIFGLIRIGRVPRDEAVMTAKLYPEYSIGRGTYGSPSIQTLGRGATVRIGSFCSFADGVKIFLCVDHRSDWVTTYPFSVLWPDCQHLKGHPTSKGDVEIGNDVWVGDGAAILSGVTIGTGAVIGCRAVVTKDVPPYAIAAGNPAKVGRFRFDAAIIDRLLASHWWDLPENRIKELAPLLLSNQIEKFLAAVETPSKPVLAVLESK